ncbi:MAG: hypothetical protein CM15mP98_03030 [Paracoccaceae bacterium]|nr:MAG: hypothetical protein CM15mP98_03030 [Paracoccaceae bacterium]
MFKHLVIEDSNGFTPRDNKIKIGTQESVDVVLENDKYWSSKDFESMRPLLADSVYVSFAEVKSIILQMHLFKVFLIKMKIMIGK